MNHTFKALLVVSFLAISSPLVLAISPQISTAGEVNKGGQVIESQGYHLEFVPEKTAKGMHLDFYLQKSDTHAAIANAKITAEVKLPDGKKQTLPLTYDAKEKHYTAILETKATGDFKVAMLCDINGKKVNGRFSFKR
jgi:hypothetical protein